MTQVLEIYLPPILIDLQDKSLFDKHSWYITRSGYAATAIDGKEHYLHKMIMPTEMVVDHKDGNKLNNSRGNLRICTHAENMRNQKIRKDSTTGYKGVSYRKDKKKYRAYIMLNGRRTYLGNFKVAEDAARAYNQAAVELFGEFARLNNV